MKAPHQLATLLGLFSAQQPVCDAAHICQALQCSRATGYRYLKALVEEGWLSKVANGRYALGLRIAQLHGVLLHSHPLLQAAPPALQALAARSAWPIALTMPCGVAELLDVLYSDGTSLTLQHGRARTQWPSATGCLWLSRWPSAHQQACYAAHHADFAAYDWARDWPMLQATLQAIDGQTGHHLYTPDGHSLLGVAVPVLNPYGQWVATLSAEAPSPAHALPATALEGVRQPLLDAAWAIRKAQSQLADA